MGFIRTLLGLVVLAAIVVIGFWLYSTYTISNVNDRNWVMVNSYMPQQLRLWSCDQVKTRLGTAETPAGCN